MTMVQDDARDLGGRVELVGSEVLPFAPGYVLNWLNQMGMESPDNRPPWADGSC
jgi:hypothetical protein